jgi:hypothetical protein
MRKPVTVILTMLSLASIGCQGTGRQDDSSKLDRKKSMETIIWKIDNLSNIGGHAVKVLGQPKVIDTDGGKAVWFDGVDDALWLETLPVAGWKEFAIEVEFRPDAGGLAEQRYFHLQEDGTKNRIMLETRLVGESWYSDAFLQSGEKGKALIDPNQLHPVGKWYTLRVTYDGKTLRHYIDGHLEGEAAIPFDGLAGGTTSIGVRQNLVCWYKGAIRAARFAPRAL